MEMEEEEEEEVINYQTHYDINREEVTASESALFQISLEPYFYLRMAASEATVKREFRTTVFMGFTHFLYDGSIDKKEVLDDIIDNNSGMSEAYEDLIGVLDDYSVSQPNKDFLLGLVLESIWWRTWYKRRKRLMHDMNGLHGTPKKWYRIEEGIYKARAYYNMYLEDVNLNKCISYIKSEYRRGRDNQEGIRETLETLTTEISSRFTEIAELAYSFENTQ